MTIVTIRENWENADKQELARSAWKFAVKASVGYTIKSLIKSYTPADSGINNAQVWLGALVLTSLINEKAGDWADTKFDRGLDFYYNVLQSND